MGGGGIFQNILLTFKEMSQRPKNIVKDCSYVWIFSSAEIPALFCTHFAQHILTFEKYYLISEYSAS